ncbi:hypothetical protein M3Y97_00128800 [Aphelenchoides bicaudatus]|nr:hypothetical protein M3Y97_00128800 [Aphelenchoides bicaudatus]
MPPQNQNPPIMNAPPSEFCVFDQIAHFYAVPHHQLPIKAMTEIKPKKFERTPVGRLEDDKSLNAKAQQEDEENIPRR